MRRLGVLASAAALVLAVGAGSAAAAPSQVVPAQPSPIGPKCNEPIHSLVVAIVTANGSAKPGDKIQYIQPVYNTQGGFIGFQYCVVTVPES